MFTFFSSLMHAMGWILPGYWVKVLTSCSIFPGEKWLQRRLSEYDEDGC